MVTFDCDYCGRPIGARDAHTLTTDRAVYCPACARRRLTHRQVLTTASQAWMAGHFDGQPPSPGRANRPNRARRP